MEKTLIMLKPDAFEKGIVGEVLHRIERSRFSLKASKIFQFDNALVDKFYAEHIGKDFFEKLKIFMMSGPTMAVIVEAENGIKNMRALVGKTDPAQAAPGTIRYDYATNGRVNTIHASDSPESAEREIGILFS